MLYADLHIHSNYSDGKFSPEKIVDLSKRKNIKYISITDHDTIDSQYIVNDTSIKNINIIPGLEISSQYKDSEIHILAYFIDLENKNLKNSLNNIKYSRQERVRRIISKLNDLNIDINIEDIDKEDYNKSIGRPHIAKVLVDKGLVGSIKEAFQKYLMKNRPAFVERCKIDYKEALKLILDAKGVPILAHPGEIYRNINIESIIKDLKMYGLKGIEVFHPSHSPKTINNFYNLAKKYSMAITGGSDCHGNKMNGEYMLGTIGINETLTHKFLKSNYKNLRDMEEAK
ncbi:PHP domain-containing protein [Clostridium sp. PL3]|uniref:PHP domain-containing protein n=1 Tax=Clostridium thailandense TaxID=2794346 RepID=A0A949WSC2_9CLOT|nr:PHP domain-containing protein [Clostridium thailandense]MBV7274926.1 PHP domain-containing protein [Clostridium thailandense]